MLQHDEWKEWSRHVLSELQRLNEEQRSMGATLIKNTCLLEEHMRRTKINEENLSLLRTEFETKIDPIDKHVILVGGLAKIIMWGVALPASIYYVVQLFRLIKG